MFEGPEGRERLSDVLMQAAEGLASGSMPLKKGRLVLELAIMVVQTWKEKEKEKEEPSQGEQRMEEGAQWEAMVRWAVCGWQAARGTVTAAKARHFYITWQQWLKHAEDACLLKHCRQTQETFRKALPEGLNGLRVEVPELGSWRVKPCRTAYARGWKVTQEKDA